MAYYSQNYAGMLCSALLITQALIHSLIHISIVLALAFCIFITSIPLIIIVEQTVCIPFQLSTTGPDKESKQQVNVIVLYHFIMLVAHVLVETVTIFIVCKHCSLKPNKQ